MNDPKTAAQHNSTQTGEAYFLSNAEIEAIRERTQRYTNQDHLDAAKRLLAEREGLVKERDALREQVTKLREALEAIDSLTPLEINTSNYNHDDVCALNANAAEAGLTAHKALAQTEAK